MSRPVALSRIEDLGVRNRDDPGDPRRTGRACRVDGDGVRALHEALHPTLLLLAFAGYQVDDVAVARPGNDGDIVLVTLSPRNGALFSWSDTSAATGVACPRRRRSRSRVPLEAAPGSDRPGRDGRRDRRARAVRPDRRRPPFLGSTSLRAATSGTSPTASRPRRRPSGPNSRRASRRPGRPTPRARATTGLLAALLPDLWTFPLLPDPADFRRQTIKQLGDRVTGDGFTSAAALQAFLLEEAWVRDRANPLSVDQRLGAVVGAGAADSSRPGTPRPRTCGTREPERRPRPRSAEPTTAASASPSWCSTCSTRG